MESVDVKSGEAVMNQGDTGDFFYIIRKGTAEVWQQGLYDNEQKLVAKLETGDHFGEEALVTGGARNASVKMTSNGNLLRLNREDFQELITQQTIEEVDIDKAHQLLSQGCKMLDVRYQEEYEESHVPGVQLIPLPELRNRLDELEPDTQYIASCLSGKRSAVAAMILKQHGFNVLVLEHGLRDWPYEMVSEF
nr:cyclic nucleotide-binding domain-containing protein [Solemya velum gill symbiont]